MRELEQYHDIGNGLSSNFCGCVNGPRRHNHTTQFLNLNSSQLAHGSGRICMGHGGYSIATVRNSGDAKNNNRWGRRESRATGRITEKDKKKDKMMRIGTKQKCNRINDESRKTRRDLQRICDSIR
ncbi:hypothetical protein DL93DRAFT_1350227 [Clavulina sp. PMI_390]|nr:hypothetical protein DL93DRAFT_1350227 [Clavulina sp. PMI_390]